MTKIYHFLKTFFSWVASILTDDDPIEYYVGYIDGKHFVRGLSCYFAQVAGLHWLSTVPSERRKCYDRAMQGYQEYGHFREYKKLK